jgi:hypothetical protein
MKSYNFILFIPILLISLFSGNGAFAEELSSSLYLSPYSGTFFVGSTFNVSVFVNTQESVVNAIEVDLKFPPDLLQVTNPTAGVSFISVWADQPSYSNKDGIISFKGGVPNPGIKTSAGLVSTITFRAKTPGTARISFSDSSKVLLADGKGTNILKSNANGEYILILEPPEGPNITSPTHPSQASWYANNNPVFFFEGQEGVTDYSYVLNQDPSGTPDNISEGAGNSVSLNDVGNGVWYFHVKSKRNGIWGGVSHYPIHIDNMPPKSFQVKIDSVSLAYFKTEDLLSGMDYYEVSVADVSDPETSANPFFLESVSPYKIPSAGSGKYMVLVRAYDKAGNYAQEQAILTVFNSFILVTENGIRIKTLFLPFWLIYSVALVLLIFLGWKFFYFFKRRNLGKRLKTEVAEAEKEIEDVRRLEKNIREMRNLEEGARKESERLADRLRNKEEPSAANNQK